MIETRLNCIRTECRSPYACESIARCADTLTPEEDCREFGYGLHGGKYGAHADPRPEWTKPRHRRRQASLANGEVLS